MKGEDHHYKVEIKRRLYNSVYPRVQNLGGGFPEIANQQITRMSPAGPAAAVLEPVPLTVTSAVWLVALEPTGVDKNSISAQLDTSDSSPASVFFRLKKECKSLTAIVNELRIKYSRGIAIERTKQI